MKQINGDNPGNILNRLLYFFQCIHDHKKGSDISCEINNPYLTISSLETFDRTPSRLLCDGLWNSINYENLKLQLNSDLNFFDIGCGAGTYGKFLKKMSSQYFGSYTGLDIYKHNEYPSEFTHIKDKAENASNYINNKTNIVISQSALEHIEKDRFTLNEITKKLNSNNKPFIQIHAVPAVKSLWLYLWHGYRQYSLRNLSNISNELKKNHAVNSFIIPLGGENSFWTHLKHITIPVYFKKMIGNKNFKWYEKKNIEKIIIDSVTKELNCHHKNPIFWVIVLTHKSIKIKDNFIKKIIS
jgi:SAM-dependent methyltransferase